MCALCITASISTPPFVTDQERAWYDAHREAILQGGGVGGDGEVDVGGVDLFPYFSSSCYKGFSDAEGAFYDVYRKLFATICEEDQGFSDEVRWEIWSVFM